MEFIYDNWLAIASLAIALMGGVPGVVAAWNEWKARPQLSAYLRHIVPFQSHDVSGTPMVGVILHLAIGNKGKDPLVPVAFQLGCQIGKKWIDLKPGSIPEGFLIRGQGWEHKYTNVIENDIQKRQTSISRKNPMNGFLSFVTTEISFEQLNRAYLDMPIKLKCVDLFSGTHEFILNSDLIPTTDQLSALPPGRGVEVKSDPSIRLGG